MYIYIVVVILVESIYVIPFRNLDKVFTYNQMALMSHRIHSHVKVSMGLMRADHLFTHTYIRSPLNIILKPILMFMV